MALAIGSIMAVVAVLLSHMDRKDVVTIIPKISLRKQINPLWSNIFYGIVTEEGIVLGTVGIFFSVNSQTLSPCWLYTNSAEDLQGYSAMQAPLLNRGGHKKAAKKEKIGFEKVLRANFLGWKNSQCRKKADREHPSDRQG